MPIREERKRSTFLVPLRDLDTRNKARILSHVGKSKIPRAALLSLASQGTEDLTRGPLPWPQTLHTSDLSLSLGLIALLSWTVASYQPNGVAALTAHRIVQIS